MKRYKSLLYLRLYGIHMLSILVAIYTCKDGASGAAVYMFTYAII